MEATLQSVENVKRAAKIFEEYGNVIRHTVFHNVNDRSIIDDILQDFFLTLVRKPIPSDIQNIKSYLRRAVKNDILDTKYKTKSYYLRNRKYAEMHTDLLRSDTPVDIISHAEEIRQLFDIVENQLSKHEAEAIIHKYHYGRNISEISDVMGVNKRSISCYLCKGLRKLGKLVRQERS